MKIKIKEKKNKTGEGGKSTHSNLISSWSYDPKLIE